MALNSIRRMALPIILLVLAVVSIFFWWDTVAVARTAERHRDLYRHPQSADAVILAKSVLAGDPCGGELWTMHFIDIDGTSRQTDLQVQCITAYSPGDHVQIVYNLNNRTIVELADEKESFTNADLYLDIAFGSLFTGATLVVGLVCVGVVWRGSHRRPQVLV